MLDVKIMKLVEEAVIPQYSLEGDAGLDLTATFRKYDEFGNMIYHTGLAIEIPKGYVGLLFPRSSVSKKQQFLTNAVGVIDSNYRGEIMLKFKPTVQSHNKVESLFNEMYEVGEKIGQLIILPYPSVNFILSDNLSDTVRGSNGFGSTDKNNL